MSLRIHVTPIASTSAASVSVSSAMASRLSPSSPSFFIYTTHSKLRKPSSIPRLASPHLSLLQTLTAKLTLSALLSKARSEWTSLEHVDKSKIIGRVKRKVWEIGSRIVDKTDWEEHALTEVASCRDSIRTSFEHSRSQSHAQSHSQSHSQSHAQSHAQSQSLNQGQCQNQNQNQPQNQSQNQNQPQTTQQKTHNQHIPNPAVAIVYTLPPPNYHTLLSIPEPLIPVAESHSPTLHRHELESYLTTLLTTRIPHHRRLFYLSCSCLPFSFLFTIFPGPNLPFMYNAWRVYRHYRAWDGGTYLLDSKPNWAWLGKQEELDTMPYTGPLFRHALTHLAPDSPSPLQPSSSSIQAPPPKESKEGSTDSIQERDLGLDPDLDSDHKLGPDWTREFVRAAHQIRTRNATLATAGTPTRTAGSETVKTP